MKKVLIVLAIVVLAVVVMQPTKSNASALEEGIHKLYLLSSQGGTEEFILQQEKGSEGYIFIYNHDGEYKGYGYKAQGDIITLEFTQPFWGPFTPKAGEIYYYRISITIINVIYQSDFTIRVGIYDKSNGKKGSGIAILIKQ